MKHEALREPPGQAGKRQPTDWPASLRQACRGQVVGPADAGYDTARRVWNGAIDRYPAVVVYCADAADVAAAVRFARGAAVSLAVRSGGHNVAGLSTCDGGLVIDLSRMKQIEVDPARREVRAEAGLTLGEFDRATLRHGLATTMGVNGDTGIAGLTLGGGFGKLARKFGLTCDNLIAAEIVTADGRHITASEHAHADLFWGIRGGGGNFGIVTAFHYRLHPVPASLPVCAVRYPRARAAEAMRHYDRFARQAPDDVCADAAWITGADGEPCFSISACHVGDPAAGRVALQPLLDFGQPVDASLSLVPYLQMQSASDGVFPRHRRYYWKAQFLDRIDAPAIDAIVSAYAGAPSASSLLVFQHVGGAIARVPGGATPYGNRQANFDCFPVAIWDDPADDAEQAAWVRAAWQAVRPFSTGGVYVNNLGEEGVDRIREAYGANYARLLALKRRYDPENLFRRNQNIDPAAS